MFPVELEERKKGEENGTVSQILMVVSQCYALLTPTYINSLLQ